MLDSDDIVEMFKKFIKTDEYKNSQPKTKLCSSCKLNKKLIYFRKDRTKALERDNICKLCRDIYYKQNKHVWNKWIKENKTKIKVYSQNRAARKNKLPNTLTYTQWLNCLEYFNYRCAVCKRNSSESLKIVPDHWIALSSAGEDNPGTCVRNIVPLCHGTTGCNNRKSNNKAVLWVMENFKEHKSILDNIFNYFNQIG